MAKINPPRKRGLRFPAGIPFKSDWRFYGTKKGAELSDREFQLAIGATRFSFITRLLLAIVPLVLGGLLLKAGAIEIGRAFVTGGILLLVLFFINTWLEIKTRA